MPPIDKEKRAALLIDVASPDRSVKGRALEDLITLVFEAVPGIKLERARTLDVSRAQEIDHVFINDQERRGLPHLPAMFFVESKNWGSPVGAPEIGWFATKVRDRNGTFAVMVVKDRVSGTLSSEPKSALLQLTVELSHGVEIVIVDERELTNVPTGEVFAALLEKKWRFSKSVRGYYHASDEDLAGPRFRTGLVEALREIRREAVSELMDARSARSNLDRASASVALRAAAADIERAIAEVADDDWFWAGPRAAVVAFGATAIDAVDAVVEFAGWDAEWLDIASSLSPAPRRVRADTRLWAVSTDYFINEYEHQTELVASDAALAIVEIALQGLMQIDSIEPPWDEDTLSE